MKNVSLIIVSYNTKELILDCLKSVYLKTEGIDFEIIVVDNDSKDGSVEAIEEKFPEVIVIKNGENLGFGKANNVGIEHSRAEYVFLLNPDTVLRNNAVKILYDYMNNNPDAGACGGMLYDAEGKRTFSFGRLPSLKEKVQLVMFPHIFLSKEVRGKINYDDVNNACEAGYISGADLMIRRDVLDKTGYFDKDFFMYYEETELQFRIKKAGYKICVVPDAQIVHLEGKSSNKSLRREASYKSEYLYFKKCYKLSRFSWFKIVFFIYLFPRFFSKPDMILRVAKYVVGQ